MTNPKKRSRSKFLPRFPRLALARLQRKIDAGLRWVSTADEEGLVHIRPVGPR